MQIEFHLIVSQILKFVQQNVQVHIQLCVVTLILTLEVFIFGYIITGKLWLTAL